ncbi:Phhb protein [Scheffersomyces coipomensis]|uniref:Phhb protein n=1 Tax=Scheffersomyces coipomensis TaxID=1788519 RepID=UPI00315CE03B
MSKLLGSKVVLEQLKVINSLGKTNRWSLQPLATNNGSSYLTAKYQLKTFKTTWKFLNEVAKTADELRHHPTIETTYNKIDIKLTTHDEENHVTELDLELAKAIEEIYTTKFDKSAS